MRRAFFAQSSQNGRFFSARHLLWFWEVSSTPLLSSTKKNPSHQKGGGPGGYPVLLPRERGGPASQHFLSGQFFSRWPGVLKKTRGLGITPHTLNGYLSWLLPHPDRVEVWVYFSVSSLRGQKPEISVQKEWFHFGWQATPWASCLGGVSRPSGGFLFGGAK